MAASAVYKVVAVGSLVALGVAFGQAEITAALNDAVTEAETGFMPGVYTLLGLMVTTAVGFALVGMMRK